MGGGVCNTEFFTLSPKVLLVVDAVAAVSATSADKGTPVNVCSTWADESKGDEDGGGEGGCCKGERSGDEDLLLLSIIVGVVGSSTILESES